MNLLKYVMFFPLLMLPIIAQAKCIKKYELSYQKSDIEFTRTIHINIDNVSENCGLLRDYIHPKAFYSSWNYSFAIYRDHLFLYLVDYNDIPSNYEWKFNLQELAPQNGEATCYVKTLIVDMKDPDKEQHLDLYIQNSLQGGWPWQQQYLSEFITSVNKRFHIEQYRVESPFSGYFKEEPINRKEQSTIYGNGNFIFTPQQYKDRFSCKDSKGDSYDWICGQDKQPIFGNFELVEISQE